MNALLAYLFLALVISFICSLVEAVFLSIPRSYLNSIKDDNPWAISFLNFKKNVDTPLSAILALNTVAHTIGAAGVGAEATDLWGDSYLGVVSAILTVLILFFSEIIPKTIGAIYCKKLSRYTFYAIKCMIFISYPLVIISNKITSFFAIKKETVVTREQISALANLGYDEGVFSKQENKIIQNIINLKKIKASEIMTPRVVVFSVSENLSLSNFKSKEDHLNFSRIPIYSNQKEKITGYIYLQDILEKSIEEKTENIDLKSFKRDILTLPNSINLFSLFNKLIEKKEHISMIVDEYGGFDGIVTMEDIIETLLGLEIIDENDKVIDMQEYAKQKWKKKLN